MPDTDSPNPYAHWMLREIHEQPDTLTATLDRYVADGCFREDTCAPIRHWLAKTQAEIVIAASGSSRHAGMVAELLIEDRSGIAVNVEYASEYSYRPENTLKKASVLVVSQSGETADTLASLRRSKAAGCPTLAITNAAASSMAREAIASFPIEAGRERAIPATKSFTAQLLVLDLLALMAAESRGVLSTGELAAYLGELAALPRLLESQLAGWEAAVRTISLAYQEAMNFLFLGRGVHYPIAREGALKLKESAYLHAEGYPSGELKHGPNALVGEGTPLVMLATVDRNDTDSVQRYEKVLQLMRDMREQGANIFAIANTGDEVVPSLASATITVAPTRESLLAICEIVPLQMFAYFMAIHNGIDVDHPRNLVKAVVQE